MSSAAPAERSPIRKGVLLIIIGSTLISFSAVFVKLAHVGPSVAGLYRNIFGALALLVIVAVRRETLWKGWGPVGYAAIAGLFFAFDLFCWHRSIHYIGPGLATIMGNFQVVVLAVVGVFVFREKATWRFFVSIPLVFVGLLMLVGIDWGSLEHAYKIGIGLGVVTAITYAGFLLTLRRSQQAPVRLGVASNLAVVTIMTGLFLSVAVGLEGADLRIPDTATWVWLIAYGVICQAVAWVIISRGLTIVPASLAGLLLLLQPTLTFVWDIVLFQRPTTLVEGIGAALALGAIYLGANRST